MNNYAIFCNIDMIKKSQPRLKKEIGQYTVNVLYQNLPRGNGSLAFVLVNLM